MSRQSRIENFYKVSKKRNLSLVRATTPTKSSKLNNGNKNVSDVINLCSDDDDIFDNTPKVRSPCVNLTQRSNNSEEADSESSTHTILYSPEKNLQPPPRSANFTPKQEVEDKDEDTENKITTKRKFSKPIKTELCEITQNCFQTPKKSPQSGSTFGSSHSLSQKSPRSTNKFFSPVRKRSVKKPGHSVTTLESNIGSLKSRILFQDDLFSNACEGMDNKTIFLLQIINECLNTPSLKQLLDAESQTLLTNSLQVVKPGMRLVCRLYWRKNKWYMKEQVVGLCSDSEETINVNFHLMITSLLENNLVVQSNKQNMTFDDLVSILKRYDLIDICKELKMNVNSKKKAIKALRSFSKKTSNISNYFSGHTSSNSRRVLQMMSAKVGLCYKLSDLARRTFYKLYLIMYLGMDYNIIREKKLELTLIYDKIKQETYPIDRTMALDNASVVFRNRVEFERYYGAHLIYEEYISIDDKDKVQAKLKKCAIVEQAFRLYKDISEEEKERYIALPKWLHRFTPAGLYVKILESGVQDLKRDKQYAQALSILDSLICQNTFRQHKKAEWYAEKALILHSCGKYDEAAEVLLEGFRSDLPEEAMDSMRPRAKKIASQKNITLSEPLRAELIEHANKEEILEKNFSSKHIDKPPMERTGPRGKVKFETRTWDGREVKEAEEYCIAEYLLPKEFTDGKHWEGRIVTTLFFLLFWDIIYSRPPRVRGVFLSRYQRFPLDLFTDSFYANRKDAIDDRLSFIENASEEELLEIMKGTWDSRPEHELSGLSRDAMSWGHVWSVARCLRARGLAALCGRLATRYYYSHSGFPDLTLWHAQTNQIKFVEVKTDTDKPSMKQLHWMQYLHARGIPAEFCYVGARTTKQRCRVNRPQVAKKPRKTKKKAIKVKLKTEESEPVSKIKLESEIKTEDAPMQDEQARRLVS